jgi:hypothetical protein
VRLALEIVGGWLAFGGVVLVALYAYVGYLDWRLRRLARKRPGYRRPGYLDVGPRGRRRLP